MGGDLISPVEVAGATPERVFVGRRLGLRNRQAHGLGRRRFLAVHGLFDSGLLLALEQGVVVEWILGLVTIDRQVRLDLLVLALELEVILDDVGEERRCLYWH